MIISNAWIGMAAQREYREERSVTEHREFWLDQPELVERERTFAESVEPPEPEVDLSRTGSLLAMYRTNQTFDLDTQMDARSRLNLMILESLYKSITGNELKVSTTDDLRAHINEKRGISNNANTGALNREKRAALNVETTPPARMVSNRNNSGPGLVYQRHERYQEQEALRFQAVGVVRTADGKEINFSVAMNMSREFVQESNLQVEAGSKKIDPLVINFDGLGASLSQTRFEFDLDNNGTTEQIAQLRPGSGYLALDRNGDGTINNGSELFGPSSGRGFAELAVYDEDGNNFIDEGDSIYHQLRIWMTNEDGTTQLAALGDKNIGAIFLGNVSSPFQIKDADNNTLGEVVNSGVYLTEDGKTGVIQEINLSV